MLLKSKKLLGTLQAVLLLFGVVDNCSASCNNVAAVDNHHIDPHKHCHDDINSVVNNKQQSQQSEESTQDVCVLQAHACCNLLYVETSSTKTFVPAFVEYYGGYVSQPAEAEPFLPFEPPKISFDFLI